jgi:2',3'-cyclic-nucleotide 2'-phosphodiesterase (5'-nucleotidase family)
MSLLTKKKTCFYSVLVLLGSLILTSCNETTSLNTSVSQTNETTSSENTSSTQTIETTESTTITTINTTSTNEPKNFQILAVNDFHGACVSEPYYNNYKIGIQKMGSIFKDYAKNMTTFILSAGDMWQGSIESNSNHGAYVTEAMNEIGFDAMTIGNHDFDWGLDYLKLNSRLANFPFLGANIIDKQTNERPDFISSCTLIEKDNVKLGVIGIIGEEQYSDITYTVVKNLTFDSTLKYVSNCAKNLREEGADFIVLMPHQAWDLANVNENSTLGQEKRDILDNCGIDLVINGHAHSYQSETYNNIPLVRAICNGEAYDQINCTLAEGKTTINSADVSYFTSQQYNYTVDDFEIKSIYTKKYDVTEYSNTVIGTCNGYISNKNLAKFGAETGYLFVNNSTEYSSQNIIGFFHNSARSSFSSGNITNGLVWNCFPFDNEIIILNVKGEVLIGSTVATDGETLYPFKSQYGVYPQNCCDNVVSDNYYKIAVIDYLGYKIKDDYLKGDIIHTGKFIRDAVIDRILVDHSVDAAKYN